MNILDFLPLLAGIGLFLYGMELVSGALEKLAGANLERTLEKLTNSKIKGVSLGAAVTAVIQSSAATTVMVVGFLNAGIIKLTQAVPVIMGANIGTTITAQILRLGDMGGNGMLLSLLKPSSFAPILIAIGAFIQLLSRNQKTKNMGLVALGLGCLFFGMSVMETTLAPLRTLPAFQNIFVMFRNPLLGILMGAVVTALLQSSSASVGLLQALTTTGAITFSAAVPIILGQNIGTCFTVFLASIGANKNAKRAVFFHLAFNIIGTVIFMVGLYGFQSFIPFWNSTMNRGNIADFHTAFNIINTILLLPFTNQIISLSKKVIKKSPSTPMEESLAVLDQRFLQSPTVALEQSLKVLMNMGEVARDNYRRSVELLYHFDEKKLALLHEQEDVLDRSETVLENYVVQLNALSLEGEDSKLASEILHMVVDFERIGDHSVNLAEVAEYNHNQNIQFTDSAFAELRYICDAVQQILDLTLTAYRNQDQDLAHQIEPLEQIIDRMKDLLKERHIGRLQDGRCTVPSGVSFLELLTNLERISDHCSNIGVYILRETQDIFDSHEHLKKIHVDPDALYRQYYTDYEKQYYLPLNTI